MEALLFKLDLNLLLVTTSSEKRNEQYILYNTLNQFNIYNIHFLLADS